MIKTVIVCLVMLIMILVLAGGNVTQKGFAMSFEDGNHVFVSTWRVNYHYILLTEYAVNSK